MLQVFVVPLSESVTVTLGCSVVAAMLGRHKESGAPGFHSWHTRLKWHKVCFHNFHEGVSGTKYERNCVLRRAGMRTLMRPKTHVGFQVSAR